LVVVDDEHHGFVFGFHGQRSFSGSRGDRCTRPILAMDGAARAVASGQEIASCASW
jgi:hypothetical protein